MFSTALTLLFLKLEIKALLPYTTFGCLICFVFQKKARTPLGKYINPESGIMLTPLKSAERQQRGGKALKLRIPCFQSCHSYAD